MCARYRRLRKPLLLLADDPALYVELFEKMGQVSLGIWKAVHGRNLATYFALLRFGDDLGYKSSTMLPRPTLSTISFRSIERLSILSMPTISRSCSIAAAVFLMSWRTSFKYVRSMPSTQRRCHRSISVWLERYGDRIGLFGGIDMDVLCQMDPDGIRTLYIDSSGSSV